MLLISVLLLTAVSCRFDYGEDPPSEIEDPPDFILRSVVYEVHMSDRSKVVFEGEKAEFREGKNLSTLYEVQFYQYSRDGELLTHGEADEGEIDLNTEDALLTGNVTVIAVDEDMTITAPRLQWERESETLSSAPSDIVTIEQSDGTMMQGKQFIGDLYRRTFEFAEDAEGVLYE